MVSLALTLVRKKNLSTFHWRTHKNKNDSGEQCPVTGGKSQSFLPISQLTLLTELLSQAFNIFYVFHSNYVFLGFMQTFRVMQIIKLLHIL